MKATRPTVKRCFQLTQVLLKLSASSALTSLTPRGNALYVEKMQGPYRQNPDAARYPRKASALKRIP